MKNTEYILYLDMDGVLVDFGSGYRKLTKGMSMKDMAEKYGADVARKHFLKAGVNFWATLDWEYGGKELFETAARLFNTVRILSSAGTTDPEKGKMVVAGKRLWIKTNLPSTSMSDVIIVPGKHVKKTYATKNSILVDDVSITIKEFSENGGYGILHNSTRYRDTIETLEDIARPIKISELARRYYE